MAWLSTIDQMGNRVELGATPQRIVSLVPSQTELLHDLGLEDKVVGITKFCVHPSHWRKSKMIIGGTKNFELELINQLQPDLIIGNKEENYKEGIDSLKSFPTWMSDIETFTDAITMIRAVAHLTGTKSKGEELVQRIQTSFGRMKPLPKVRTLYLMWRKPWMGAANKTFISSMMSKIGLQNVLTNQERYPHLSVEMLKDLAPELVLLSSEPYPFEEKHVSEIREHIPKSSFRLVDGQMFSWYGSRLASAPAYFGAMNLGS